MHRGVLLLFALVNVSAILLVHRCSAQGNGSCNVEWQLQPIQEVLPCDPFGVDITLECSSDPATLTVSWFWTQNVSQAGINGTQILLGASQYTVTSIVTGFQRLLFNVNEFTVGYYWCEILDAGEDTRPSAIVALCSDSSLTQCSDPYENVSHNIHLECAIQEPNFRVSHSGLPMECAAPPSVTVSPTRSIVLVTSMSVNASSLFSTISSLHQSDSAHVSPSQYQSTSAYVSPSGLATESLTTSNFMTTTDKNTEIPSTSSPSTQTSAMSSMAVMSTSPTSSIGSPDDGVVLYALVGVCLVLAVIALLITVAIIVLCCLTRRRNIHQVASPSGKKSPVVGVTVTELRTNGSAGISSGDRQTTSDNEMILNMAYLEHRKKQALLEQKTIDKPQVAFSNPTYRMTNIPCSAPVRGGSILTSSESTNNSTCGLLNSVENHQANVVSQPPPGIPLYAQPDLNKKQSKVVQQSLDQDYEDPDDHKPTSPTSNSAATVPVTVMSPMSPGSLPASPAPFTGGTKRVSVIYDDLQHEEIEQFRKIEAPSPYIEPNVGCSSPTVDGIYSDLISPLPPAIPPHTTTPSPDLATYSLAGPVASRESPVIATYNVVGAIGADDASELPRSYDPALHRPPVYEEAENALPLARPEVSVATDRDYDYADPDQMTPPPTGVHPAFAPSSNKQELLENEYSLLNSVSTTDRVNKSVAEDGGDIGAGYSRLSVEVQPNGSTSLSAQKSVSVADREPCYDDPWDMHSKIPTGVRRGSSKKSSISAPKQPLTAKSSLFDDPAYEALTSST